MPATEPAQERVEGPNPPVILVEVRVHDKFVESVLAARVTVPMNPLTGATDVVEVPAAPELTVTLAGLADIVKSWVW